MRWVKLTLLEARGILDALPMNSDFIEDQDEVDAAIEILQAAIDTAEDEDIPYDCKNI